MAKVFIIMGSKSDFPIAEKAIKVLNKFGVAYDIAVASAHRTPQRVEQLVTGTDAGLNYDALLSIVQMPPGIPVAAVGMDRGDNAATLAIEMLALSDPALAKKLADDRKAMAEKVEKDSDFVVGEAGKVQ